MKQLCFVNCGLPGDQCACFREHMAEVYTRLLADQQRLPADFEKVWSENVEELYEP
jgi:hypothetical protein